MTKRLPRCSECSKPLEARDGRPVAFFTGRGNASPMARQCSEQCLDDYQIRKRTKRRKKRVGTLKDNQTTTHGATPR